ncbi:hypothetical protein AJ80_09673 [Polytolypa hystricis UAMH7299]|uniref:FAS1 domain-containing protein n=1 Tax=Polytolypa hystricis (strain UAMH7299) TaxID=1447883 RepID=A0A2B7WLW8_POLH7|nr:hypothetical protein AJ80_09673 [Polytolypa hystricis UAMH7299]
MKLGRVALISLAVARATAQSLSQALSNQSELSLLSTYIQSKPNLRNLFGNHKNITILAPENSALEKLIPADFNSSRALPNADLVQGIITYHILNGTWNTSKFTKSSRFLPTFLINSAWENMTTGQVVQVFKENNTTNCTSGLAAKAKFLKSNIAFDNGLIHVINDVLTLPQTLSVTALAANLTSFVGAMNITNSTRNINSAQNITVFAPNNDGWDRISSATANMSDSNLSRVVDYHVIPDTIVYSSDMRNRTLRTKMGTDVHLSVINGTAFVNSAKVVSTDLLVHNGVLHVLADALNPNNSSAKPEPKAKPQPVAFGGANSRPPNRLTSGVPTPTSVIPLPAATSISGRNGQTETPRPTPTSATTSSPGTGTTTNTPGSPGAAPVETAMAGVAAILGVGAILINA